MGCPSATVDESTIFSPPNSTERIQKELSQSPRVIYFGTPPVFLIHINDINQCMKDSDVVLFANDTAIYINRKKYIQGNREQP